MPPQNRIILKFSELEIVTGSHPMSALDIPQGLRVIFAEPGAHVTEHECLGTKSASSIPCTSVNILQSGAMNKHLPPRLALKVLVMPFVTKAPTQSSPLLRHT